jgi:phosphoribosylformylglycinamidine synthase
MKVTINIFPKVGVKDNQGIVVLNHLKMYQDIKNVKSLNIGKYIVLDIDETDPIVAKELTKKMCELMLVNQVIEEYTISVHPKMEWELHTEADRVLKVEGVRRATVGIVAHTSKRTGELKTEYDARLVNFNDKLRKIETIKELGLYENELTAMLVVEAALKGDKIFPVCDNCYQASCWQGEFFCDYYKSAGIVYMTEELIRRRGSEEHESYFKDDETLAGE